MNSELIPYLRLLHIVAGTFWVGANMFMAFFIYPTAKVSGEAGKTFVGNMVNKNKLPVWMSISSLLTILSGLVLLMIMSGDFSLEFFKSNYGIGLTIGAGIAIFAFFHGFIMIRPCGIRLSEIGKELSGGEEKISEQLRKEIEDLNAKIASSTNLETGFLIASLVLMIISKYL